MKIYCPDLEREINNKDCYNLPNEPKCKVCPYGISLKFTETKTPPSRINPIDRRMAIKRCPEFEEDYKKFQELNEKGDENAIAKKMVEMEERWGEPIEAVIKAEESYKLMKNTDGEKPLFSVKPVTSINGKPIIKFSSGDGEKVTQEWIEGDYLYLKVNIRNVIGDKLKKDFKAIVDEYKKILKDKSRDRKLSLDHWEIWDKKHKEGKNYRKITRELFDVQGDPIYDGWSDKLSLVIRARKKAESIFKAVRSELNLPPYPAK